MFFTDTAETYETISFRRRAISFWKPITESFAVEQIVPKTSRRKVISDSPKIGRTLFFLILDDS